MTSPSIKIRDTTPAHIRLMALVMNESTAAIAHRMGISPNKALWKCYRQAIICKTAFINSELAAIFGVAGSIFSDIGEPFLIMTKEVGEYPFKVAFIYRSELSKMQKIFPILQEYVDVGNDKAIRLLKLMGFEVDEDTILDAGIDVYRAERRVQ